MTNYEKFEVVIKRRNKKKIYEKTQNQSTEKSKRDQRGCIRNLIILLNKDRSWNLVSSCGINTRDIKSWQIITFVYIIRSWKIQVRKNKVF